MNNLCICGHSKEDHTLRSMETDGTFSTAVLSCHHDQAYFKGMCICPWYSEVDNLTHIEILAKQRNLV